VKRLDRLDIMIVDPSRRLCGRRGDQALDLCKAQLRPLLQPGELYRALEGKLEIS
jgi:hypothetical protein